VNSKFEKGENVKVEEKRELANRGLSVSGSGGCAQNDDFLFIFIFFTSRLVH